jgi:hypothetical protein
VAAASWQIPAQWNVFGERDRGKRGAWRCYLSQKIGVVGGGCRRKDGGVLRLLALKQRRKMV